MRDDPPDEYVPDPGEPPPEWTPGMIADLAEAFFFRDAMIYGSPQVITYTGLMPGHPDFEAQQRAIHQNDRLDRKKYRASERQRWGQKPHGSPPRWFR